MEAVKAVIGLDVPPDGQRIEQNFQAGNASLDRRGTGEAGLVFRNYAKPGDSMTLDFDMATKKLAGLKVSSYTTDPSQPVSLAVQFGTLPDGTNYPATRSSTRRPRRSRSRSRTRTTRSSPRRRTRRRLERQARDPRGLLGTCRRAGGMEVDHLDQQREPFQKSLDDLRAVAGATGERHEAFLLVQAVALELVGSF